MSNKVYTVSRRTAELLPGPFGPAPAKPSTPELRTPQGEKARRSNSPEPIFWLVT